MDTWKLFSNTIWTLRNFFQILDAQLENFFRILDTHLENLSFVAATNSDMQQLTSSPDED